MAKTSVLFFSVIAILLVTGKIQEEKLKLFLTNHEVSEILEVDYRSQRLKYPKIIGAERSFQITAFGNTFTVDLSLFYPREDSEITYISKTSNVTDSFLSSKLLLHQGYVRNFNKSLVIGHFNKVNSFRGYMITTDEVFCIEPYEKSKVIVYKLKDVISPGCSKTSESEDLDCSDTRYFKPWYIKKVPSVRRLFPNSNLFYDNYLEYFQRVQMKKAEEKWKEGRKNDTSTGKHHDRKGKHDKNHQCLKNGTCDHHKPGENITRQNEVGKESGVTARNGHNVGNESNKASDVSEKKKGGKDKMEKSETEKKKEDREDEDKEEKDNDEDDHDKVLKDSDRFQDTISTAAISNNILSKTSAVGTKKMKRSLFESEKNYQKQADISEENLINKGNVEALKNDPVEALQCNVEVVVAPSLIRKLDNDIEIVMKDIFVQFRLLDKILSKMPLRVKGKNTRFKLQVDHIVLHADEAYSPFTKRVDLEYFKTRNRPYKPYCLHIGLVNQHLKSGDFFDGYTPEGKGGICSIDGDIIMVSHGNENTPAPMALYFASLIRAVTRAIGASDKDSQCAEGSYPNPMQILKDYFLTDEIVPTQKYSIFTKCSVKEIEKLFQTRGCLRSVSQPLCGDAVLDPGEECDCGPIAACRHVDNCCNPPQHVEAKDRGTTEDSGTKKPKPSKTSKLKSDKSDKRQSCTLIKGSECSTLQECCDGCKIDKLKRACFNGPSDCDIATCDGKSASCPSGVEASNGMVCFANHTSTEPLICKDKKCDQPLCSSYQLEPCTCALGTKKECFYCCLKDGKCQAAATELKLIPDRNFNLPEGTVCMGGVCLNGKCVAPSGMRTVYNHTLNKPPSFPVNSVTRSASSALNIIIGHVFSLLVLFALQPVA